MTLALAAPIRSLFELVERETAGGRTPDLDAIGAALSSLAAEPAAVRPYLDALGDRSGSVPIHVPDDGPRLSLVHRLAGQMSAIHDHGTWVAISPIRGLETHRRWRVRHSPGRAPAVEIAAEEGLDAADVATLLPPDDVHDHGHLLGRGDPAYVLILLGDDQAHYRRNEWDAATGRHRVLEPGDRGRWIAAEPLPDAAG